MNYVKTKVAIIIIGISLLGLLLIVSDAPAQTLPAHLPKATCSRLHHLHGVALWKHYLWHLCNENRAKYVWISSIVQRESGWQADPPHNNTARGLAQFLPDWANGSSNGPGWVWDRTNPILSLRIMIFVWNRPSLGGPSNWSL